MKKIVLLIITIFFTTFSFSQISILGTGIFEETSFTEHHYTIYTFDVTLVNGFVKFRENHDWTLNWGGSTFPTGTAVSDGPDIPVTAGTYHIVFDMLFGSYSFTPITVTPISLIGDAMQGWTTDVDMKSNDGINYKLDGYHFSSGSVKFRQNHNWDTNWGGTAFPNGIGVLNSTDNIPVNTSVSGNYSVDFNLTTDNYNFTRPIISILGTGVSNWFNDVNMTTTDGITYTLLQQTLSNGEVKFRLNNSWVTNWGNANFPMGTGIQDGANIPITAGVYDITFNFNNGTYTFIQNLNTNNFSRNNLKVFPNPSSTEWNFSAKETIESIEITDVVGKTISRTTNNSESISIDASQFNSGIYFTKITIGSTIQTLKLIKN
jgi:starch-binding outer membrane protein SusE/F